MRACARRSRCASLTEPDVAQREVPQAAVHQLGRGARRGPGHVAAVDDGHARARERRDQAVAAPIAPPPMTRMSNGALDRRSSSSSRRSTTRATTLALGGGWRTRRSCPPPSRSGCRAARRRGAPARASHRGRRACASCAGRARARGRSRGRRRAPSRSGCPAAPRARSPPSRRGLLPDIRERLLHRAVHQVLDRERVAVDRRMQIDLEPALAAASSARSRTAAWRPCASSSGGRSSNVIRRVRSTAVTSVRRTSLSVSMAARSRPPRSPAPRDRA